MDGGLQTFLMFSFSFAWVYYAQENVTCWLNIYCDLCNKKQKAVILVEYVYVCKNSKNVYFEYFTLVWGKPPC